MNHAVRIIVFGASGMVGQGALLEALDDPDVTQVLAVVRSPTGRAHPKLTEVVHNDFADLTPLRARFVGFDACFYCLGVTAVGMTEADYTRVTYDYALAAATAMRAACPGSVFIYVSGAGADRSEKGSAMWARVKGRTENALLAMPLAAYMFRPGFIRPERGITSRTKWYRLFYAVTKPFGGLLARGNAGTTTTRVGRAMLAVARTRPKERIVETRDINQLAG